MQLIRTPSSTRKKMKSSTNGTPAKLLQSPPPPMRANSPNPYLNFHCQHCRTGSARKRRLATQLTYVASRHTCEISLPPITGQFNGNEPVTAVSPRAMWLYALGHPSAQIGTTRSGALGVPPESVPARWYFLPESAARKW